MRCGWNARLPAFCGHGCRHNFLCRFRCGLFPTKTISFSTTFLFSGNNNTTKFQLCLLFFARTTLFKAGAGVRSIFNIITVAGSEDAITDAGQLTFADADADPKFQDLHISGSVTQVWFFNAILLLS